MKTIVDFFVEAAIKKGAPSDLADRMSGSGDRYSDFGTRSTGLNYKFQWALDDENTDTGDSFTIYGDGSFSYDSQSLTIDGKLTPPHSKTWIRRMVNSGMDVDFAKMHWAEFYAVRHGS